MTAEPSHELPNGDDSGRRHGASRDEDTLYLVGRVQDGDVETGATAYQDAWSGLSGKVRAYLRRTLGKEPSLPRHLDADDLWTDVLCGLLRGLPTASFDHREKFWGFVRTIANNRMRDVWRQANAECRADERAVNAEDDAGHDVLAEVHDDRLHGASAFARARELDSVVAECVAALPREESRRAYYLRVVDELEFQAIAERIGRKNADTARVIFARARQRVQQCLERKLDAYTEMLGLDLGEPTS